MMYKVCKNKLSPTAIQHIIRRHAAEETPKLAANDGRVNESSVPR